MKLRALRGYWQVLTHQHELLTLICGCASVPDPEGLCIWAVYI